MIRSERSLECYSNGFVLIKDISKFYETTDPRRDSNQVVNSRIAEWHYWCRIVSNNG